MIAKSEEMAMRVLEGVCMCVCSGGCNHKRRERRGKMKIKYIKKGHAVIRKCCIFK